MKRREEEGVVQPSRRYEKKGDVFFALMYKIKSVSNTRFLIEKMAKFVKYDEKIALFKPDMTFLTKLLLSNQIREIDRITCTVITKLHHLTLFVCNGTGRLTREFELNRPLKHA